VNRNDGIGLGTLLFLVFLVLKLTEVIDWSWWAVTAPLWIPIGIVVGALAIGYVLLVLAAVFGGGE
jgi:hypothetical protein